MKCSSQGKLPWLTLSVLSYHHNHNFNNKSLCISMRQQRHSSNCKGRHLVAKMANCRCLYEWPVASFFSLINTPQRSVKPSDIITVNLKEPVWSHTFILCSLWGCDEAQCYYVCYRSSPESLWLYGPSCLFPADTNLRFECDSCCF